MDKDDWLNIQIQNKVWIWMGNQSLHIIPFFTPHLLHEKKFLMKSLHAQFKPCLTPLVDKGWVGVYLNSKFDLNSNVQLLIFILSFLDKTFDIVIKGGEEWGVGKKTFGEKFWGVRKYCAWEESPYPSKRKRKNKDE